MPEHVGNVDVINTMSDSRFLEVFGITRRIFKIIRKHMIALNAEVRASYAYKYPMNTVLQVCLWYLKNDGYTLMDAVTSFNLPTEVIVEEVLLRGFEVIVRLGDLLFGWPTKPSLLNTERFIYQRYNFPKVVGVLGKHLFVTQKGERLLVQVVCDEKRIFRAVHVSFDTRLEVALYISGSLISNIREVPKGYYVIAGDDYTPFVQLEARILTPIEENTQLYRENNSEFNLKLRPVLELVDIGLAESISRFPGMEKLHQSMPEALHAAFVLHNFCATYSDDEEHVI